MFLKILRNFKMLKIWSALLIWHFQKRLTILSMSAKTSMILKKIKYNNLA
nr:MAG TPA: hypothetical protein [Caudoviricetes sp.]